MKPLQVKQLKQACQENKYLIASYVNGAEGGINCQISAYVLKNKEYRDEKHTKILSVYPCSFMEYISLKSPFVKR